MRRKRLHSPQARGEDELILVATGKMRLPQTNLKIRDLLKIPTGKVEGRKATDLLLEERDQGR